MRIAKLEIKNFRTVGNVPIVIEWNDNTRFNIISAKNGEGKSTLFYAIAYGLFGVNLQTKGASKTHNPVSELINDTNKKEMMVSITLDNGVVIKRGMKPTVFEVIDAKGKTITNASSKNIDQEYLEEHILKTNYETFAKTTMLTAKPTTVPFVYMTPQQRKKHIEELLGIDIFRLLGEEVKVKEATLKLDKKEFISKASEINTKITMLQNFIEDINNQPIVDTKKLKRDNESLTKKLNDLKDDYHNIKAEVDKLAGIEDKFSEMNTRISEIDIDILKLDRRLNDIINKVKTLKEKKEAHLSAIEKAKNNNAPCDSDMRLSCPLVKSMIPDFDEGEAQEEVKKLKDEHNKVKSVIDTLKKEKDALLEEIQILKDEITSKQGLVEKVSEIKEEASKIKETIRANSETISLAETQKDDVKEKIKEYKAQIANLKTELSKNDKEIDVIERDLEALDAIKKKALSNSIKEEMFGYATPIFQDKVNYLLRKFFESDKISVSVEITPLFDVVLYKDGVKSNIFNLSEGQIGSLNFAFVFGFLYLMQELYQDNSLDVLYIDEILDIGLDEDRLNSIIEHLQEISNSRDVTIISHNKEIDLEMFDRVLKPHRDELGFTKID